MVCSDCLTLVMSQLPFRLSVLCDYYTYAIKISIAVWELNERIYRLEFMRIDGCCYCSIKVKWVSNCE